MSSATENTQDTAPGTASRAEPTETFHPERTHILSAVVLALISLLTIGAAPQYLWWILIFPALIIWWVLKSATVVDSTGIEARYAFRGNKAIAWDDFAGIGFKGARTFARATDGTEISLPGVTFNSLPRLQQASYGRIPDALTEGRAAMDGKIVVVQEDGYSVVLTKDEYLARQKELGREIQIEFDEDNTPHDVSHTASGNNSGASGVESPGSAIPTAEPTHQPTDDRPTPQA